MSQRKRHHIYDLFLKDDDTMQGRLYFKFEGVVEFVSKSDLVECYMDKLKTVEITLRRMVIFKDAAQILLNKCMRK